MLKAAVTPKYWGIARYVTQTVFPTVFLKLFGTAASLHLPKFNLFLKFTRRSSSPLKATLGNLPNVKKDKRENGYPINTCRFQVLRFEI